jgi:2-amino-4-hydroxy-6-hydroxymethyldihydropteridine diphosphokinase
MVQRDGITAFIALGSNLGDRLGHLRDAVEMLDETGSITVVAASRVYETPPIGPPQDDYLNAVISIRTTLNADKLLRVCQGTENLGGRQRTVHWGPRTIDLDILDFGGHVMESDDLVLPHPGIAGRPFVLVPLRDVDPDWSHPVTGQTVGEMLQKHEGRKTLTVFADHDKWCVPWTGRENGS